MLTGNNKVALCKQDLMNAIQYYLNQEIFKEPVQVTNIEKLNQYGSDTYEISISPVEQKEADNSDNG